MIEIRIQTLLYLKYEKIDIYPSQSHETKEFHSSIVNIYYKVSLFI